MVTGLEAAVGHTYNVCEVCGQDGIIIFAELVRLQALRPPYNVIDICLDVVG